MRYLSSCDLSVSSRQFTPDAHHLMKRYVVLEVDSPIEFFRGRHRITYGALEQQPDGSVLPVPMDDETERSMIEEMTSYHRARLV